MDPRVFDKLELVLERISHTRGRESGDVPVEFDLHSGFRTPAYNRHVPRAARDSRHQFGDALDVAIDADGNGKINRKDARIVAGGKNPSVIARNTDAMMQLIGDLIDFSSSGLGRAMPLNRGPVDLEALCREVIDSFRALHPGRTLRFHSEGDVNGVWDAGRIRQVVSNLMGNAIQHGSPEAPIDLSVASKGTAAAGSGLGGSTVVLSVHNEGVPIPPDLLPTIFDPLKRYATRESAAERSPGSIGLGLYIVREIVVAKGGTVEVASTAEEGTTFTVRIPRFLPVEGDNSFTTYQRA